MIGWDEVKEYMLKMGDAFDNFKTHYDAKLETLSKTVETIEKRANRPLPGASDGGQASKEYPMEFIDANGNALPVLSSKQRISDLPRFRREDSDGPFSLGKMVRGLILGDWKNAERERKQMGEGTGSLGGYLVPETISNGVIDLARAKAVCIRAGALTLPMDSPEVTIVKIASDPTAYWRGENAAITESTASFEPVKLRASVLACLVRVSIELLEDAQSFTTTIENAISQALALELDRAGLLGSGAGEPRGIWNTSGVNEQSLGANGGYVRYSDFGLASQRVFEANGIPNACIYSRRTWGNIDRFIDGMGNPATPSRSFQDLEKHVTTQIPDDMVKGTATTASGAIVGDFKQLLFGMRSQLILEATRVGDSDTFTKMQALIRAYLRADVAVLRPDHFTKITGILDEAPLD